MKSRCFITEAFNVSDLHYEMGSDCCSSNSSFQVFVRIFMSLCLATAIKSDEQGVFFEVEENRFLFAENTIWNGKVDSLMSCSQMCARQDD